MVSHVNSDAYYFSEPKSQSRVGSNYFLSSRSQDPSKKTENTMNNGTFHIKCGVLSHIVSSVVEDELGVLFQNTKITIPLRITLQ